MRYLCLLVGEPDAVGPVPGSEEFRQMLDDYGSATAAMREAGVLVDSGPLQPVEASTTVRVRGGRTLVTDGPFTEVKEVVGGYYLLDCADLAEAQRWAATIPAARYGAVELHPQLILPGHD